MSGIESETVLEPLESIQEKLDDLKTKFGFREPDRGDLDNPEIEWRVGKPDYTRANYQYLKGKTQNHAAGTNINKNILEDDSYLQDLLRNLLKIL